MAMRDLRSVAYTDDELLDMLEPEADAPEYPMGLQFGLAEADIEKAGVNGGDIGDQMRFSAMGEVASINKSDGHSRIELKIEEFAGEDGKFFDLETPAHICLCNTEFDKLDLDDECELGDMIHLIGTARLCGISKNEFVQVATLQIIELDFEDESEESREG